MSSIYCSNLICLFLLFTTTFSDVLKKEIEIIGKIPHNRESFTQGLIFENEFLFESTGAPDNRISEIKKIDPKSGAVIYSSKLSDIFAEGLTFLNNEFTVLSWKSGIALKLRSDDFRINSRMSYMNEGWGLTDDESVYIMSNGSDTLYLRDANFAVIGKVPVKLNGAALNNINEIEFINGSVYANIWYSDVIYEINISTGNVKSEIDCTELRKMCSGIDKHDVLNGIAYNDKIGVYYLTGKDWPWIFKVKIK